MPAIEEAIFAGVPITVTLLFSREQYVAAAEAYLRGVERRIDAGLEPGVESVASLFISRWDVAVMGKVPEVLKDQLGMVAIFASPLRGTAFEHGHSQSSITRTRTIGERRGKAGRLTYFRFSNQKFTSAAGQTADRASALSSQRDISVWLPRRIRPAR